MEVVLVVIKHRGEKLRVEIFFSTSLVVEVTLVFIESKRKLNFPSAVKPSEFTVCGGATFKVRTHVRASESCRFSVLY